MTDTEFKKKYISELDVMINSAIKKKDEYKLQYSKILSFPYSEKQKILKMLNVVDEYVKKIRYLKTRRLIPLDNWANKKIEKLGEIMFIRIYLENLYE